jgi:hypothetical protein
VTGILVRGCFRLLPPPPRLTLGYARGSVAKSVYLVVKRWESENFYSYPPSAEFNSATCSHYNEVLNSARKFDCFDYSISLPNNYKLYSYNCD